MGCMEKIGQNGKVISDENLYRKVDKGGSNLEPKGKVMIIHWYKHHYDSFSEREEGPLKLKPMDSRTKSEYIDCFKGTISVPIRKLPWSKLLRVPERVESSPGY